MGTNNQTNWLIMTKIKNMVICASYFGHNTILDYWSHIHIQIQWSVSETENDKIKEKRWIGCNHGNAQIGVSDSWEAMKLKPTTRKIWEKFLAKK